MRILLVVLLRQVFVVLVVQSWVGQLELREELVLITRLLVPDRDHLVEAHRLLDAQQVGQGVLRQFFLLFLKRISFLLADGEGDLPQRRAGAHLHLLAAHDGPASRLISWSRRVEARDSTRLRR